MAILRWWCGAALGLGALGCSLRNLDELDSGAPGVGSSDPSSPEAECDSSPAASDCKPAGQATCALKGATCERLPDGSGCRRDFCRWGSVANEPQCGRAARLEFWLPAHDSLARQYPLAVPEGSAGACVTPIEKLSCEPAREDWCAEQGASCDLAKNVGLPDVVSLCRWSGATSEELCAAQPGASWIPADSSFARAHPASVAPNLPGACISNPMANPEQSLLTRTELCFELAPAFRANGGDYPSPDANETAGGLRFRVTDALGNSTLYDTDAVSGCRTLFLDALGSYRVSALSHLTFADGNEVSVMENDSDSLEYEWSAASDLVPGSLPEPRLTFTWPALTANDGGDTSTDPNADVSTVLAALGRSFADHALTTGQLYPVYLGGGNCGNPCVVTDAAGQRSIFLRLARKDKFVISSLVARLGSQVRLGGAIGSAVGAPPQCGLSDPNASTCANAATHLYGSADFPMGTEEYGNCAFANGWAQYVATSIWNRPDQADCQFRDVDCYEPGSAAAACYAGSPQTLDTGFERDWLTALWALERSDGCGIGFSTIVSILESAEPLRWTNADARTALVGAAPSHLTGSALDCFTSTLLARISR